MIRSLRMVFTLAIALSVGLAVTASAQSQAEFKRELKAGQGPLQGARPDGSHREVDEAA